MTCVDRLVCPGLRSIAERNRHQDMDIEIINPELRMRYRMFPDLPYHRPALRPALRVLLRVLGNSGPVRGVSVKTHRVEEAQVRLYRPPQAASGAGLLWMHGGGYIVGCAAQDDRRCSSLARELGLVVISVDYRLAPEQPFPAALDDCREAWDWLQVHADELGVDKRRVAIAGESAGGGLAACLAQRLCDEGGVQPAAQVLCYPMLDDRTTAEVEWDSAHHLVWNNENNRGGWSAYLGCDPGSERVPDYAVAARRVDVSGLPPAWIGVGDKDLFYGENRRYAERLSEAGVPCELDVVPGAPHAFPVVAPKAAVSIAFVARMTAFLRQSLIHSS